jgi:hypothetical protein
VPDLLRSTVEYCQHRVAPDSIYGIVHRECFALFPDEMFAGLFTDIGRRSVPPMIVAVVMVLQRIEGLDRFAFDHQTAARRHAATHGPDRPPVRHLCRRPWPTGRAGSSPVCNCSTPATWM